MIEKFESAGLDEIMSIWLDSNIKAHPFIAPEYWKRVFNDVREALPASDLYFCHEAGIVNGFIGIIDPCYVAGLFVSAVCQSRGIGRELLNHCKKLYHHLELDVFVENPRAVNFYLQNGFVIESEKYNPDFAQSEYHLVWP